MGFKANVIEVFAGAGGLAQGIERSGHFASVAFYDIFEAARQSYLVSRVDANYFNRDVSELTKIKVEKDLKGREVHGIIGGPPCQGFSLNGRKDRDAEINQLVVAYGKLVKDILPKFLVMENVPQLLFHPLFQPLMDTLSENYNVAYGILNAARYGTPQTRHRLFVIAYRKDFGIQPTLPKPTHGRIGQKIYTYNLNDPHKRVELNNETALSIFGADSIVDYIVGWKLDNKSEISKDLKPLITVGDAISDLVEMRTENSIATSYKTSAASDYQRVLRATDGIVGNCTARRHVGKPLVLAQTLPEGGTPQVGDDAANVSKKYYSQAYGRLHRAGLARTITTFFQNAGSGRFIHYQQPRTLTIREAARLQGFSDDFIFTGTLEEQMEMIGNAVPLPLAEAIGHHIAAEFVEKVFTEDEILSA